MILFVFIHMYVFNNYILLAEFEPYIYLFVSKQSLVKMFIANKFNCTC